MLVRSILPQLTVVPRRRVCAPKQQHKKRFKPRQYWACPLHHVKQLPQQAVMANKGDIALPSWIVVYQDLDSVNNNTSGRNQPAARCVTSSTCSTLRTTSDFFNNEDTRQKNSLLLGQGALNSVRVYVAQMAVWTDAGSFLIMSLREPNPEIEFAFVFNWNRVWCDWNVVCVLWKEQANPVLGTVAHVQFDVVNINLVRTAVEVTICGRGVSFWSIPRL